MKEKMCKDLMMIETQETVEVSCEVASSSLARTDSAVDSLLILQKPKE